MTSEIRITAADSGTLSAHLVEDLMGRPLTRDHMLEANRRQWGLRETAREFKTTRYQVRLAEVRTGVVLEHARAMPERVDLPPDQELWTAIEGGESFVALAERCGVNSKTIIRRLMAWAAKEGRSWPPRTTQEQRLYEARQRTVEASQRMGLLMEMTRGVGPLLAAVRNAFRNADAARDGQRRTEARLAKVMQGSPYARGTFFVRIDAQGQAWLLDPVKRDSGVGFVFRTLDDLWRTHPELRPVRWGDDETGPCLFVEAFSMQESM